MYCCCYSIFKVRLFVPKVIRETWYSWLILKIGGLFFMFHLTNELSSVYKIILTLSLLVKILLIIEHKDSNFFLSVSLLVMLWLSRKIICSRVFRKNAGFLFKFFPVIFNKIFLKLVFNFKTLCGYIFSVIFALKNSVIVLL